MDFSLPQPELIATIKVEREAALKAAFKKLEETTQNGIQAGLVLSQQTDALLTAIFKSCCDQACIDTDALALVAVGGYGRQQLAPGSDIDLLFLVPDKSNPQLDSLIESCLYLLWDAGFKVGQATRNISECVSLAREDVTIATTLLEARLLTGNADLFAQLMEAYASRLVAKEKRSYLAGKLSERTERHNQVGASRFALEPNIKEGIGGLRDLQTLYWILKFLRDAPSNETSEESSLLEELKKEKIFTSGQANTFVKAERFLWALRFHLHDLAGRAEERLTFDFQPDVAKRMGYNDRSGQRAVERFMSHYFVIAKSVGNLTRIVLASIEKEYETTRRFKLPRYLQRQKLVDGFPLKDRRVSVDNLKWFKKNPQDLLRIFAVAQKHRLDIDPKALQWVTQSLKLINRGYMNDPKHNAVFLEMLLSRKDPGATLRRLNNAGILERFIPDFGRIVGMMQFDRYHHFTVDEHTLFAIDNLYQLEQGTIAEETPLSTDFMGKIKSRKVLYVAVLLHDIAKGRNGPHEVLGAEVARRLCPRFGLDERETDMVAWLVLNHLELSNVVIKRDIDDPQTVKDYAELVASNEYAQCLHILTSADIRAVGPGTWNSWKASMMRHMYFQTRDFLRGGLLTEGRQERIDTQKQQVFAASTDLSEAGKKLCEQVFPDSYWLSHATYDIVRQLPILLEADAEKIPLKIDIELPNDAQSDVTNNIEADPQRLRDDLRLLVYLDDHHGVFSRVAGAIAVSGGSIEDARIHTLNNGRAVQVYTVKAVSDDESTLANLGNRLENVIPRILRGELIIQDELAQRQSKVSKRVDVFARPSQVFIDNEAAERHTVIEITGHDRPGALYWITKALSDMNLQISTAKVTPLGARYVDVFYVQDLIGQKIRSEDRLAQIKAQILDNLANLKET